MIPHIQTIFGDGSDGSTPGNCMQTAVASALNLRVDQVPHFVDDGDGWWSSFLGWIAQTDRHLTVWAARFSVEQAVTDHLTIAPISQVPPMHPLLLACGQASRGFRHIVLWSGGLLAHDPHPSGEGLIGDPDEFWWIESRVVS